MSNVTVVILTKNEEINIVDDVENAKGVADKIILVDSGSVDDAIFWWRAMEQLCYIGNGIMILVLSATLP